MSETLWKLWVRKPGARKWKLETGFDHGYTDKAFVENMATSVRENGYEAVVSPTYPEKPWTHKGGK